MHKQIIISPWKNISRTEKQRIFTPKKHLTNGIHSHKQIIMLLRKCIKNRKNREGIIILTFFLKNLSILEEFSLDFPYLLWYFKTKHQIKQKQEDYSLFEISNYQIYQLEKNCILWKTDEIDKTSCKKFSIQFFADKKEEKTI